MFNNDDAVASVSVAADFGTTVDDTGEGGLLGMAFHPSFSGSGQVYFNYTITGPSQVLILDAESSILNRDFQSLGPITDYRSLNNRCQRETT
ncbi:PQQ-dependent sugar dehydrogenase [bacterium]|nr:PQQ-dependent sugar dehydrogenase [bacterium]